MRLKSPPDRRRQRLIAFTPRAGLVLLAFFVPLTAHATPSLPETGKPAPVYHLDDCLTLALQRNPNILRAESEIKRTEGVVISAKSSLYPHLTASGRAEERNDDTFKQGTDPKLQGFRDYWVVQITATQSLYSAGVNQQQIAIAKLQNQISLLQLQAVMSQVVREVHYAVYEIMVDEAEIDAWEKSCQLLSEELDRQKQYFDAGKTTRFTVLRTQVNLGNQQGQLEEARARLVSARVALAQLLQIPWPAEKRSSPPFLVQEELACPPVKGDLQGLQTQALSQRPELQILQRQIDVASRQITIDRATNVPRVDFFTTLQQYRDQTQSQVQRSINDYSLGILGTWDVFDGFLGRGRVIADTAQLDAAKITLNDTRLQIQNNVRDAYERLKVAGQLVTSQSENVKTAEESVRLSQNSADAGYATPLDILQSTLDLTTSRLSAVRARYNYMKALADLHYAISLRMENAPTPAPASTPDAAHTP